MHEVASSSPSGEQFSLIKIDALENFSGNPGEILLPRNN